MAKRIYITPTCGHIAVDYFDEIEKDEILDDDTCFVCGVIGGSEKVVIDYIRDGWLKRQ